MARRGRIPLHERQHLLPFARVARLNAGPKISSYRQAASSGTSMSTVGRCNGHPHHMLPPCTTALAQVALHGAGTAVRSPAGLGLCCGSSPKKRWVLLRQPGRSPQHVLVHQGHGRWRCRLAGVEGLTPGDAGPRGPGPPCGPRWRALATELQVTGVRVRRGHGRDLPAHAGTASEEDVVNRKGSIGAGPMSRPGPGPRAPDRAGLVQQTFQHGGSMRVCSLGSPPRSSPAAINSDGVQHQLCRIVPQGR